MTTTRVLLFTALLASAGVAGAQPVPAEPVPGDATPNPVPPVTPPTDGTVDPPLTGEDITPVEDPYATPATPATPPKPPGPPRPAINMPEVLTIPTGWLLPAAVLYSRTSLDTGGGVTSDSRVGLGDVAEFGVATTDAVREKQTDDVAATRIQPYLTASFRLGVAEDRLFSGMPGVALGFRKSFERNHDGYRTRIAELTLVASRHIGKNVAFHVGGAFWDASVFGRIDGEDAARRELAFHDGKTVNQLRAFGGLEVRPLPRSQILIDLGWAPEFCYRCTDTTPGATRDATDATKIRLRPTLSWGVRYQVSPSMRLESGVRVPDIGQANLLDAQIFGQMTLTTWALRRAVDRIK